METQTSSDISVGKTVQCHFCNVGFIPKNTNIADGIVDFTAEEFNKVGCLSKMKGYSTQGYVCDDCLERIVNVKI
ncbi:MAG: hypothetical protein WC401_02250 [Bacteroidales bacterium]|jgi:hypothetical protein